MTAGVATVPATALGAESPSAVRVEAARQVFRYRAEDHTYWLGARRLLGVSEILRLLNLCDPTFYTDASRDRGHRVHDARELFDAGLLEWSDVLDEDLPYVKAYARFRTENPSLRLVLSEYPLYDAIYLFAGMPDAVFVSAEEGRGFDVKTGAPQPWHVLQFAAYRRLYNAYARLHGLPLVTEWRGLYLGADGRYRQGDAVTAKHEALFLAAVSLAWWRNS